MKESTGRQPMPRALKAFLFCYIGGYILSSFFHTNLEEGIIIKVLSLTIGSVFFSYGVICFVDDIRNGGIRLIINKIKKFIND